MTSNELDRIALEMHALGFRGICVETQEFESSLVHGIHIGCHFFPMSELDDLHNRALLFNGMFAEITERRPASQLAKSKEE